MATSAFGILVFGRCAFGWIGLYNRDRKRIGSGELFIRASSTIKLLLPGPSVTLDLIRIHSSDFVHSVYFRNDSGLAAILGIILHFAFSFLTYDLRLRT